MTAPNYTLKKFTLKEQEGHLGDIGKLFNDKILNALGQITGINI